MVKNSIAVLVRVMEKALRDGLLDRNPARITGWQREYARAEDELDDPRSFALPDWTTLTRLSDALAAKSSGEYAGWGDVVLFAACTAARIGEVSGCWVKDIDTTEWTWNVRRQTMNGPGGLIDKGTKGNGRERCRSLRRSASWWHAGSPGRTELATPGCSPGREVAESPPPFFATRPTGTRW